MTPPHLTLHLLVRWLDFLGVAVLIGGVAFRSMIMRPSLVAVAWGPPRRLFGGALVLVGLTSVVDLTLRARMMSPTMAPATLLPLVLRSTHLGHVWLFKAGLLVALWWVVSSLWTQADTGPRWLRMAVSLTVAVGLGLAVALTGHAADRGNVTVAVMADWLHVVATAVWAGGLLWLRLLLPRLDARAAAEALRRFSRVAATCVGVLVATGLVNAFQQVASPAALVATSYGRALMVKVVLVAAMVGLGSLTRFYVIPGLTGRAGRFSSAVTRGVTAIMGQGHGSAALLRRGLLWIGFECLIGLAVLWCAAILTQVPPPRAAMMLTPPSHMH